MNFNIIKGNEMVDSLNKSMHNRLTSPLYGTFLLTYFIFHWEMLYTMFFVSDEKIWESTGLLKNEYIHQMYFNLHNPWFYFWLLVPFVSTFLIIWVFPRFLAIPAFKKDVKDKVQKRIIEIIEERRLETEDIKKLEVQKERVVKKQEITKLDPTAEWAEEYKVFSQTKYYQLFQYILDSIYQYNGHIEIEYKNFSIPRDILVYTHANDIVKMNESKSSIELTEKGKFFVKQYASGKSPQ
ncbi:MAG: hypothetical protein AAB445_01085 [Patescibacteria group bacterium]